MNTIFLIASLFFFVWIVRNVLFWVNLWQLKEYRFDRVRIHLLETIQGRSLLFSPVSSLKWILIFLFGYVVFHDNYLSLYELCIALLYLAQGGLAIKEAYYRLLKRPVLTVKAIILITGSFVVAGAMYIFPVMDMFLWLLIIDRVVVFMIWLFVLALFVPTEFLRDLKVEKATKKLQEYKKMQKKLLVIGITGSYGKSSTKDYIAQILEKKFRVLKTQGTNNTPIGIANAILSGLKKSTQIFVVEMGAYKIGEIAEMCEIVRPNIGVLTAVNQQHASLFGGIENTKKAKYEIIEALPKDGLALFNGSNDNVLELYKTKKSDKKKVLYSSAGSDIYATNIEIGKTGLSFYVHIKGKVMKLFTPLLGAHNIENILPGIYIADFLGMKEPEIKKAVASLTPLYKTMVRYDVSGTAIIDDTFNANPEAILAALEYMKIYKKKKILVMQPMIELGKDASVEHYRIGNEIGKVCDYLLLTNKNFYEDLLKGVKASRRKCRIVVGNAAFLARTVSGISEKGDVIVCEGKEAGFVLDRII